MYNCFFKELILLQNPGGIFDNKYLLLKKYIFIKITKKIFLYLVTYYKIQLHLILLHDKVLENKASISIAHNTSFATKAHKRTSEHHRTVYYLWQNILLYQLFWVYLASIFLLTFSTVTLLFLLNGRLQGTHDPTIIRFLPPSLSLSLPFTAVTVAASVLFFPLLDTYKKISPSLKQLSSFYTYALTQSVVCLSLSPPPDPQVRNWEKQELE